MTSWIETLRNAVPDASDGKPFYEALSRTSKKSGLGLPEQGVRDFLKQLTPRLTVVELSCGGGYTLRCKGDLSPGRNPPFTGFHVIDPSGKHSIDYIATAVFDSGVPVLPGWTPHTLRRELARRGVLMSERKRSTVRLPMALTRLAGLKERPRTIGVRPVSGHNSGS